MNVTMGSLAFALAFCASLATAAVEDDGGIVTKSDPTNGRIVLVNQQARIDRSVLDSAANFFNTVVHLPVIVGTVDDVRNPKTKVVLYLRDVADSPAISVEPDELKASVNIARFDVSDDARKSEMRAMKAVVRAICFVCGGGGSVYPQTINGPLRDMSDYDKLKAGAISPDTYLRMTRYLESLGVRTEVRLPYESACEEGWAPTPTNDIQRAIWEKVHAPPTKPIKIQYDKVKQKPVVK